MSDKAYSNIGKPVIYVKHADERGSFEMGASVIIGMMTTRMNSSTVAEYPKTPRGCSTVNCPTSKMKP